jgi:hypothetical protein
MSAVMLAVFSRFTDAEVVRTELVRDGFPTERVRLTARQEGHAALATAGATRGQFLQYFGMLFDQHDERTFVQHLAERVAGGSIATVTVHARGDMETLRATQVLENRGAIQVAAHDLQTKGIKHSASADPTAWLAYLIPEYPGDAARFYLRKLPEE